MKNDAENKVRSFYRDKGWEQEGDITEDARRWEDLRANAQQYVSDCRLRLLQYIPDHGQNMLDMASGPIQYPEYLEYSRNFSKRYCVDLSEKALSDAREKIGDHGEFLAGSFFDMDLPENFFDCTISLHTIYHMDKDKQETAVRKLVRLTKPEHPVIIVYSNPDAFIRFFPRKIMKSIKHRLNRSEKKSKNSPLYFYDHPVSWWYRFNDIAKVEIRPWRSFKSRDQKKIFPDNRFGGFLFKVLFFLEEKFPGFFARHGQYPMIILTRNPL
jgi:ubiquinone/menaquinone biosynthesis C-methylase UbiE